MTSRVDKTKKEIREHQNTQTDTYKQTKTDNI
jgi:hypothetical protein